MYPSFFRYRRFRHYHPCGGLAYAACAPSAAETPATPEAEARFAVAMSEWQDPLFGSARGLGVRRPLRYLTVRLGLDRAQVAEVAKVLEHVKIEQAQAGVDLRRAASEMADTLESEEFDAGRAQRVREQRLEASRRVQDALTGAIEGLHGVLSAEQRRRLATLIRSGSLRL